MAYAFKVTAKRDIAGKIAKGMSVQVVGPSSQPSIGHMLDAFKQQLGIEVKGYYYFPWLFNIEKLK